MNRVFIDMDGVLADFAGLMALTGKTSEELKHTRDAFRQLEPVPCAFDSVRTLIGMGFECWIATKPPTGVPEAYGDKVAWILRYLPELKRRIILTHDKGMLGDRWDCLIDDRPHKANCTQFAGRLLHFGSDEYPDWTAVLEHFKQNRPFRWRNA